MTPEIFVIAIALLLAIARPSSPTRTEQTPSNDVDEMANLRFQLQHLDLITTTQSAQSGAADAKSGILIAAIFALWPLTVGAMDNQIVKVVSAASFVLSGGLFLASIFMPRIRTFSGGDALVKPGRIVKGSLEDTRDTLITEVRNNETSLSTRDRMMIGGLLSALLGLLLMGAWTAWGRVPSTPSMGHQQAGGVHAAAPVVR